MIPRYFVHKILAECLQILFPMQQVKQVMAYIPMPSEYEQNVVYVRELVNFVNSDNRYKLCCVNRRNARWACFILTPYGNIRTEEFAHAFEFPYEEVYDSLVCKDKGKLVATLEECGFNSLSIIEAFIDDYNKGV